ncbi:MAG: HAD family hydrolase [Desulfovibrio sp.]|nr:MAG: HAD family hydrolase [Desulfovibrio sp.]
MIPWDEWESLEQLRGLIFDCDGVLFDSFQSNVGYYNAILAEIGMGPMSPKQAEYVHTHTVTQSLAHIAGLERVEEALSMRFKVDYNEVALPYLQPESGLYELLDWLMNQGVRMGVSTNRTTTMDRVVAYYDLGKYFFPVMTASNSRAKPSPEGVYTILDSWGYAPEEVAYIGDSDVDRKTALAADVPFWAYKNPKLKARVHVDDFWKLRRVLNEAFSGGRNPLV